MDREAGDRSSPIWLLGDSNPTKWASKLTSPLDPRHPTRHNIWTPVLEVVQRRLFAAGRYCLDTSSLYIRNALENSINKPKGVNWRNIEADLLELRDLLQRHKPVMLLTFGNFSYEFARRASKIEPQRQYTYWTGIRLGNQFRQSVANFSIDTINLMPLLHASIARGHFLQMHSKFCNEEGANYFEYVGERIAHLLFANRDALSIWVE